MSMIVNAEILVMRWMVGLPDRVPLRCFVVAVPTEHTIRYKLDESSEQGTEGLCNVEDEGIEWIRGWDDEAKGALLAAHALHDPPEGIFGAQGPQGSAGMTGTQGVVGPQGLPGVRGAQGPTGVQGRSSAGPQGITGVQGWTGQQGSR